MKKKNYIYFLFFDQYVIDTTKKHKSIEKASLNQHKNTIQSII